ncbi:ABC transporter ATP-binding protein [Brachybacterium sp. FME24]|uniref:ABC transporter ATP-binding protein n=1 Tax=Brachybacterium sp. FME24 TaxID=2742605 RepID=UPI0018678B25|nr:ABC transporter ATP-binding protein [Brachybacterium sp. FME24]
MTHTTDRGTGVPITLTDLRKDFGASTGTAAVDGISLQVPPGAFLVLLGPSGCGKTTTLRMLAGLENPTGGEIRFGERAVARGDGTVNVESAGRGVGMVFQSYALWPHKTVQGNIEWPLTVAKWSRQERRRRVREVLGLLGIEELAGRYPGEISGGQQQRVAIARTIASQPEVLLFDEPLSNLDAKLRVDTRAELMRIHRATGATSVYVTHDQVEAMTMATHVALMKDGRIEQFGTPVELLAAPRTAFTATFIGAPPANILEAQVAGARLTVAGRDVGKAPAGLPAGTVHLMYRSSGPRLVAEPVERCVPAIFVDQVPMAERWVIGVEIAGGTRVSITQDVPTRHVPGDSVQVQLPPAPETCFDLDGERIPAPSQSAREFEQQQEPV